MENSSGGQNDLPVVLHRDDLTQRLAGYCQRSDNGADDDRYPGVGETDVILYDDDADDTTGGSADDAADVTNHIVAEIGYDVCPFDEEHGLIRTLDPLGGHGYEWG